MSDNKGVKNSPKQKTAVSPYEASESVKQMFDSATLMRVEKEENPFKGKQDLNRTKRHNFPPNNQRSESPQTSNYVQISNQAEPQ